jgi:threonine dehydrogenase-like Zn-dependent dehydrogenase
VVRALVLTGPRQAEVRDVPEPVAGDGCVVVDVDRAGVCGTDVELFTGEMSYLHTGVSSYPLRPGHEWTGIVTEVGPGVDPTWLDKRVVGDTMIGCGHCRRCRNGRHHVCADRHEIGIRGDYPGALAERLVVPAPSLYELPENFDAPLGALVEPGANALRTFLGADVAAGERLLVFGTGTIGLLVALFGRAHGVEVHLLGREPEQLELARTLGLSHVWTGDGLPSGSFDGVVDATYSSAMPALALDLVEPGRRVVYIGLSASPSTVDAREIVFRDVTAVGILGGSAGLAGTIEWYAGGAVDPRPLVGATIGLDEVAAALSGQRPAGGGPGPKLHVDPRR